MKRVLFIDRDGTLIEEPDDFQVDSFAKLKLMPGVITNLARITSETDFELVIVSNQDGLGTRSLPDEAFFPVHDFLMELLEREGIRFKNVLIDRSFEHENKPTRKPNTGMFGAYIDGSCDLARSFVIGDRQTDVELARNLGTKAIFIRSSRFEPPRDGDHIALAANSWQEISEFLCRPPRTSAFCRKTVETEVSVDLNIDGSGVGEIVTGLPFLDHMLEQLAKHGGFDIKLDAKGDLHIDEHHTVEDVAIALGTCFHDALEAKRGIERFGFVLPMDDCLAQVAIDLSGRNWIVWDVEFKRERIGNVATEMFFHFFKSFSDHAKCSLNIKAEGANEHHKIESIFKAFAKAMKMAVTRASGDSAVPSTKGII